MASRRARVLVVVSAVLMLLVSACRNRDSADGAGGQSGDEGRRPSLQGTGGVTADLRTWR